MEQGHAGCLDWLEPPYWGVHELMARLLGKCTCEAPIEHVWDLYGIAREEGRISA